MDDQSQDMYKEIQQWICNRQGEDPQLDPCSRGEPESSLRTNVTQNIKVQKARSTSGKQLQAALLFLGTFSTIL
jgi:hypothetical protein